MALVLAGMAAVLPSAAQAVGPTGQVIDTSGIYRDRSDSLARPLARQGKLLIRLEYTETGATAWRRRFSC